MEERRLLLAIALSLLALTGYQLLFPAKPTSSTSVPTSQPPGSQAKAPAASLTPMATPIPATAPATTPVPAPPVAGIADDLERRVEVNSPDLSIAFTNRGARLLSWRLVGFPDERGHPEEMVQSVAGAGRPFDIVTGDASVDERLRTALFQPSTQALVIANGRGGELRFAYVEGDLAVEKVFRFPSAGTTVRVSASVRRSGVPLPLRLYWGPGVSNPTPKEAEVQGYQPPHLVTLAKGKVERTAPEKIEAPRIVEAVSWVGIETHYFTALLAPTAGTGSAQLDAVTLPPGEDGKTRSVPEAALSLAPGEETLVYVGPKDYRTLARLGHGMERVVPVGDWLGPIVVPLIDLLRLVHRRVGNYGWSIIVLTVLINLGMSPLRHYSIANGFKMAKLSPEMRAIQERYRKVPALDPRRQEMQSEIAALYARHGMSMSTQMLVGCLPILLTMPFLFAFYRVLTVAVELRGASFLWIADLSHKDPLFATPILLGISMFVMQRITPTAMDPAQQRVMMIMPLVLVVMFFAAPAGLNLYWLVSNLCSIVQQSVTLRLVRGAEAREKERKHP
jgi:YidC/Oxa1 family membrane protein insertase